MTIPLKLVPTTGTAAELREFAAADKIEIGNIPVVGTVQDTGGVPSGAIIESGSNANGRYTKYANGTLEQEFIFDGASRGITSAVGSIFQEGQESTWTFPIPFLTGSTPTVVGNGQRNDGTFIIGFFLRSASATNASWRFWASSSIAAGNAKTAHMIARGVWK